ncbi:MAG TPA: CHAT domain-containing protein [Blastocatellia bacterium]|nr:CHAT domain-containing protein [Blastocatellia bacterium]
MTRGRGCPATGSFLLTLILVLTTGLTSPALPPQTAPSDVRALEQGKPVERELKGGESHAYRVTLGSAQFVRVVVDQRGIDVAIRFSGPDGKQLTEVNLSPNTRGTDPACWIAETAGDYQIEISAAGKEAPRGRYQLSLAELHPATGQDHSRVIAQRVFMEAERFYEEGKADSRRKAVEKYLEALPLWRAAGDREGEAQTLYNAGDTFRLLNDYPKAIEYLNQAITLRRAANDRREEAITLTTLGAVYSAQGDKQKALEYYNQALPIRRELNDRAGEATTLNNIALAWAESGEYRRALDYYNQLLQIRRTAKDQRGEAITLSNIGEAHRSLGEKRKALRFFEQSLVLQRATKNSAGEAATLNSIGVIYSDLGEQQKALDAYAQALPLRSEPRGRAVTINNIGRAYDLLGVQQEALNYYSQSLQIVRSVKERRGEAQTLNYSGLAWWSLGEYQKALDHFNQALPIRRELKDAAGEAAILNNLGLVYDSIGDRQKAIEAYNQALPLIRKVGGRQDEAKTLNNLGFAYDVFGDKQKALDYHQQALKLSRDVGDRMREAKVRYGIARIERDRNRLRQARGQIEDSIKIVDSLRSKLSSPDLRAAYRNSVQQYYDLYIDVLMRMHKRQPRSGLAAAALHASERARARSLLELLAEAGADIRQGVAPELVARERELEEQLNDKTAEQIRLLTTRAKQEQVAAATEELDRLTAELRDVRTQIRTSSPRYAALTQPQPLKVSDIQRQLLDPNTLLLAYALGEKNSYLWAVSRTSLRSFTLPGRDEIEGQARRFYELLTARNQDKAGESGQQKYTRITNADTDAREAATALSRMLLAPVAAQLGNKRLIVVTDGALYYAPFAALSQPGPGGKAADKYQPLVVRHEIVSLPSASTLAVLRNETANRRPAPKAVAVLADPVFDNKDERIKTVTIASGNKQEAHSTEAPPSATEPTRILLTKSAKDTGAAGGEFRIPRLPGSRREAEAILALAGETESRSAFDFAASRAMATGDELGQYRIVHFATHGFLNSLNPELSGLVFSMVDEKGAPQNGFLLAPEVYNLKLPSTELVVLSACQTGLGREIRGEGVVGLTRGFMYAGAPRVVFSLWNVSDQASAELMKHFYQGMLARRLPPAAALRAAQVELWKQRKWQSPYFWAAFGLQGEWK